MFERESAWLLKEKYGSIKSEAFYAAVAELKAGVPLAYLIGHIPFLDTTIFLNSRPLIPRPETEFWVEKAIAAILKTHKEAPTILDLCAGSGAIGVAIGKKITNAKIDFAELEKNHLPLIIKNCQENALPLEQVRAIWSDLFEPVTDTKLPKYDFIFCNPPYIDKTLGRTAESVTKFEPELALYGGESGMEIIDRIIKEAPKNLNPQGQLWIEHEPEQSEQIAKLGYGKFATTTHKDQYDILRYSILVLQ
jgi:release factor glutamine methyltransferase